MTARLPAVRTFPVMAGWVILAIVVLSTADTYLARIERVESAAESARLFREGKSLMQANDDAAAIARLEDAILIERGNRDYRRTLAEAQLAAGRTAAAEATLTDLLQSDSTDGLASLIMARALVTQNRFAEAESYYHRAIYGRWATDEAGNRLRTRFELIDLLADRGSGQDLLAELLPVQDQAPQDVDARIRMGRLFLLADSPARAANVFRAVLRDAPSNAQAEEGLGEAEFTQTNYRAAQRAFSVALRVSPDDATRRRLDVTSQILQLDPTVRGLGSAERFRRSRQLLDLTAQDVSRCTAGNAPADVQTLLDDAKKSLKARISTARYGDVSEATLEQAEQLWLARKKDCNPQPDPQSPLALILAKLGQ